MMARSPADVFPPGEFLKEELEARGWTQTDLAEILGRPVRLVNEIIAGKRRITPETAKGLAAAMGTSPDLWLNLESSYQLWRSRSDDGEQVTRRAKLYSAAPIREMLRRGWLQPSGDLDTLERRVADFFEIKSIDEKPKFLEHAARKSAPHRETTPSQLAWLFGAKRLSRAVRAAPYSQRQLEHALHEIRTLLDAPEKLTRVPSLLGEAGIRFVVVQALPGTRIDGACFWVHDAPVVAMSLRFDRIDNFWFVLMHELAHVKNGDGALDTDMDRSGAPSDRPQRERLADLFASEQLIPSAKLDSFIAATRPHYSARRIETFARTMGVHPGIVVGQLQHRGEIAWTSFRRMLVSVREWIVQAAPSDGWGSVLPA